jgi:hypothetical protein
LHKTPTLTLHNRTIQQPVAQVGEYLSGAPFGWLNDAVVHPAVYKYSNFLKSLVKSGCARIAISE